jgi:hypothetical protein
MPSRDGHSNIKVVSAVNTTAKTANDATNGDIIDTHGFETVEFVMKAGAMTSGHVVPSVLEGDASDLSDAAEATQLAGTTADATFTKVGSTDDANKVKKLGYLGSKRYVRLVETGAGTQATGTATLSSGLAAGEKVTVESVDFVAKAKFASNIVTCAAVQAADTVTIGGVVFTAIANGQTPTAGQFAVGAGGTANADTAAALTAAIMAAAGANGGVNATNTAGQATVTISAVEAGAAGNDITLATSTAVRLAITTAGGKLAGAYDAAADEWPIESSLDLSAAALANAIRYSANEAIAGVVDATSAGAVVTVTADAAGTGGNSLTFAKTGAHIAVSGAGTLTGAVDCVATISAVCVLGDPRVSPVV